MLPPLPIRFTPLPKERIWGGNELARRRKLSFADPVGESWELCDRPEDNTVVDGGQLAGQSLGKLFADHAQELMGAAAKEQKRFPLLLKIIDSAQMLSVQVHPDDKQAFHLGDLGKTEAWYVLSADRGACLWLGLESGTDRAALARAAADGTASNHLHRINVKAGDAFFIPAGMVHAIGGGLRIAEIQQNSDITYRLFDWNRLSSDGKPRKLHVEEALACIDFSAPAGTACKPSPLPTEAGLRELVCQCGYFAIERFSQLPATGTKIGMTGASGHIIFAAEGELEVETDSGKARLEEWGSCLIPAICKSYKLRGQGQALAFYIPTLS